MNSPPKKQTVTPSKWGGEIPNLTNSFHPDSHPHPLPTPNVTSVHRTVIGPSNDNFGQKFELIHTEINHQRLKNASFEACIISLETTTKFIDSKMDLLMDRIESSLPPSQKIQKTSYLNENFSVHYPEHNTWPNDIPGANLPWFPWPRYRLYQLLPHWQSWLIHQHYTYPTQK